MDRVAGNASEQTEVTRRYDCMARIYDPYDAPMEIMGTKRRRRDLVGTASGLVLEVGVGTVTAANLEILEVPRNG